MCPENTFVAEVMSRYHGDGSTVDDSGITGVRFQCRDRKWEKKGPEQVVADLGAEDAEEHLGDWSRPLNSLSYSSSLVTNYYVTGFKLKYDDNFVST